MPADDPTTQDPPDSPGPDEPEPSAPVARLTSRTDRVVIQAVNETRAQSPAPQGWLESHLTKAAELCGVTRARLSVVVVEDDAMAQMHEQYTGVPGTTDVLTFDMADVAPAHADSTLDIEGDIVVCLDEAKRQAERRGHPVHHELLLYALHGLLHLLGEDDHDEAAYQRMHAREDELLEQLGVGRLFNPQDSSPEPSP